MSNPSASAPPGQGPTMTALLEGARMGQLSLAPDGGQVAFSVGRSFSLPDEAPRSAIWVSSVTGDAHQATDGSGVNGLSRWSPDGALIAFASDRDSPGLMALHLLQVDGGDVARLGEIGGSVEEILWSRGGGQLLVLSADVGSDRAMVATEINDRSAADPDPRVRRPAQAWRRVHRVDLDTGHTVEVSPAGVTVWDIDWHDGETAVAVVSSDPSESGWYRAFVARLDLGERTATSLHAPSWQVAHPSLSPDGSKVAFVEGISSDRGSTAGIPKTVDVSGGPVTAVSADLEVSSLAWRDDATLWFGGRIGMVSRCGSLSLGGAVDEAWSGDAVARELAASHDGSVLAAVVETVDSPPEIAVLDGAEGDRHWRPITSLNASVADLRLPEVERLGWVAPDGWDIEGLLVRPAGHDGPLPLVVLVHGGPTAAWSYAFPCGARPAALLAESGYAVLLPNPRGSSGRGQAFARAVVGDVGGAELLDSLAGVEACVEAGIADGDRVGIMGASHGGFMAAWAVTQTSRFRASIAVACVSDYLSCHHTSNIGGLDDVLFVGEDRVAAYLDRSPVVHAANCTTPTLVVHGEDDRCCPLSQAQELYGALVEAGAETELVIYPREGHGLIEREHQIDLWRRTLAWFDRHLATPG